AGVEIILGQNSTLDKLNKLYKKVPESSEKKHNLQESRGASPLIFVNLDREKKSISRRSKNNLKRGKTTDLPAYVIYTSGTTGSPKGVLVTHSAIANHCRVMRDYYRLTTGDRTLQFAPLNVDASLEQVLPALIAGAAVVIRGGDVWTVEEFGRMVREHKITIADIPPVYLHELLLHWSRARQTPGQDLKNQLRMVIVGGEAIAVETVALWRNSPLKSIRLVNAYGPTETTITATVFDITENSWQPGFSKNIPIGRPLEGTTAYILDRDGNPVPEGVHGELYIGGIRVAPGYLNNPELTAARFVNDKFHESQIQPLTLYKTGDLVRYIPGTGGQIEFLGRIDRQIKIRGFRVELGEIEALLLQHDDVKACVVETCRSSDGDVGLVAYVVPENKTLTADTLERYLGEKLPRHMASLSYVMLEKFPLTPGGVVDRRALPAPGQKTSGESGAAPRNRLEEKLVPIWANVLGLPVVGIYDNFFEMGGHSILALRLIAAIQRELEIELPLSALIRTPNIAALATMIRRSTEQADGLTAAGKEGTLVPLQPGGQLPPFFFFHPVGGNVLSYMELVRHLGDSRPIYGLQFPGLAGEEQPGSIEAMASRYIKAIRKIQPEGPYHLVGWSMGGVIAYETAQQLKHAGEKTALLALVESYTPDIVKCAENNHIKENNLEKCGVDCLLMESFFRDLFGMMLPQMPELVLQYDTKPEELFNRLPELAKSTGSIPLEEMDSKEVRRLFEIFKLNSHALDTYTPKPYNGVTLLFGARDESGKNSSREPAKGWKKNAVGGLSIRNIPGNHYTILREPNVKLLVKEIKKCLP
ncbi:MAG: amino acid adenylation domain-containing protein, partial [bacterium]|nr:amino acid adenylation domain-containing protein [bacterium]